MGCKGGVTDLSKEGGVGQQNQLGIGHSRACCVVGAHPLAPPLLAQLLHIHWLGKDGFPEVVLCFGFGLHEGAGSSSLGCLQGQCKPAGSQVDEWLQQ